MDPATIMALVGGGMNVARAMGAGEQKAPSMPAPVLSQSGKLLEEQTLKTITGLAPPSILKSEEIGKAKKLAMQRWKSGLANIGRAQGINPVKTGRMGLGAMGALGSRFQALSAAPAALADMAGKYGQTKMDAIGQILGQARGLAIPQAQATMLRNAINQANQAGRGAALGNIAMMLAMSKYPLSGVQAGGQGGVSPGFAATAPLIADQWLSPPI